MKNLVAESLPCPHLVDAPCDELLHRWCNPDRASILAASEPANDVRPVRLEPVCLIEGCEIDVLYLGGVRAICDKECNSAHRSWTACSDDHYRSPLWLLLSFKPG